MVYKLYVEDLKTKEIIYKGEYQNKLTAEKKAGKYKKYIIFAYPKEIKIGMKIYQGEELYGKIIDISDSFIYINRIFKDENDKAYFLKDEFENKFIDGIFNFREE